MRDDKAIEFGSNDTIDDLKRKLSASQARLDADREKKLKDQSPLWQAYLEMSAGVFSRDIARMEALSAKAA